MMIQSIGTNVASIRASASAALRQAQRRIAKGADSAVLFVLQCAGIRIEQNDAVLGEHVIPQMAVIAACGRLVGSVEEVVGDCLKLAPFYGKDRQSNIIPLDWIERVDSRVYLNRDYEEATRSN